MEQPELEEGEARDYKDDPTVDPDVALSYIDEKLQNLLGHLQKDFEGGALTESLGAKFGGYGSFLPMYQRSPSIRSQHQSSQKIQNHGGPRSPNYIQFEVTPQNRKVSSDPPLPKPKGTVAPFCSDIRSVESSSLHDSRLSSIRIPEKSPRKLEPHSTKLINPTDQRTLKVRIKVGDKTTQKNIAVYDDFRLVSPHSSTGNSPAESGVASEFQEASSNSAACIIQIMTSFPVGAFVLSPLRDNLLNLARANCEESKAPSVLKGGHHDSDIYVNDSVSRLAVGSALREKKEKSTSDGVVSYPMNRTGIGRQPSSNDLHCGPQPKPVDISNELLKSAGTTSEATRAQADVPLKKRELNMVKDRPLSNGSVGQESFRSISAQGGDKNEKGKATISSVEKISEKQISSSQNDDSVDTKKDARSKGDNISTLLRSNCPIPEATKDPKTTTHLLKHKVLSEPTLYEQDEFKGPHSSRDIPSDKAQETQYNGKATSNLMEENLKAGLYAGPSDMNNFGKDLHISNDNSDVPGTQFGNVEKLSNSMRRPSVNRLGSKLGSEKEKHANGNKLKKRSSCKKIDKHGGHRKTMNNPLSNDLAPSKGLASVTAHVPVNPVLIEENWVCCDHCQTWRLLPYGTKPDQLPEKWLCIMLNWLPGMNRCDISEDETTKALRDLYITPVPEVQNSLQNPIDATKSGVVSDEVRHLSDNRHRNFGSGCIINPGKKMQKLKESKSGNNSATASIPKFRNSNQEMVNAKCLTDLTQPLAATNSLRRSSAHPLNKIGESRPQKKDKRHSDQMGNGTSKRVKTDGSAYTTSLLASGDPGRIATEDTHLPSKAGVKSSWKHIEQSFPQEANFTIKESQISATERGVRKQDPHDGGSFDAKTFEMETSRRKRKLRDYQDNQDDEGLLQSNGTNRTLRKGSVKAESMDSRFDRDKNNRVVQGKESNRNKDDEKFGTEGKLSRAVLTGTKGDPAGGSIQKNQQLKKYRVKVPRKLTMEDIDSLKKDLGGDEISTAATSSSSKVSGSQSTRASYQEVKGSPIESVSSSPLRTLYPNKLSMPIVDSSRNDGAELVSPSLVGRGGNPVDGDHNSRNNQIGPPARGKALGFTKLNTFKTQVPDFQDSVPRGKIGGKPESYVTSSDIENGHIVSSEADFSHKEYGVQTLDRNGDSKMNNSCKAIALQHKPGRGSSMQPKRDDRTGGVDFERITEKLSDLSGGHDGLKEGTETDCSHLAPCNEKLPFSDEFTNRYFTNIKGVGKKVSGKQADVKGISRIKCGEHDKPGIRSGALSRKNEMISIQQNVLQDYGSESAKKCSSIQIESRGSRSLVYACHEDKKDTVHKRPTSSSYKDNPMDVGNSDIGLINDLENLSVDPQDVHNSGTGNGTWQTPEQHVVQDFNAPSIGKKDAFSCSASDALKSAEDLRDCADRLKKSGFDFECHEVYFRAALKFLHDASVSEPYDDYDNKHQELNQVHLYHNSAKLFESCAHEYEKGQDMAAAALAYKCLEVAYMKLVYCKNLKFSRIRNDLQASLQMSLKGESPSSSASDIDNLNSMNALMDKSAFSKGNGSHAGNHVITSQDYPNLLRLLDITNDMNSAMDASKKYRKALAAASEILDKSTDKNVIISLKRVIDFNFENVEEFVHLVGAAIDATRR